MAVAVVSVICLVAVLLVRGMGPHSSLWRGPSAPTSSPLPLFGLPGLGVDAGLVLGHTRAEVRGVLGAPKNGTADEDAFMDEPTLTVSYTNDVASALVVEWPQAARHERFVRRWLHLPGDGPIVVGALRLRIETFVGDNNRFGVEVVRPAEPLPPPEARPSPGVRRPASLPGSDTLLHVFPLLPENVRRACQSVGHAKSATLVCPGFDGTVSYDLTLDETPRSLTVLDPAQTHTDEDCRALLARNRPDLVPGEASEDREGKRVAHFTSNEVDAVSVWLPVKGFLKTPSCSVMVCSKGAAGGRSSCMK